MARSHTLNRRLTMIKITTGTNARLRMRNFQINTRFFNVRQLRARIVGRLLTFSHMTLIRGIITSFTERTGIAFHNCLLRRLTRIRLFRKHNLNTRKRDRRGNNNKGSRTRRRALLVR